MCEEVINVPDKQINFTDDITKLNDRLSAMGKFIAKNNQDIIEKIETLSFFNQIEHSESQDQLFAALCKAKANMKVDFEKTGNSNRGGYATYSDLVYHARPFLSAEGVDIIHEPIERGNYDFLKTTVTHKSGQWRSSNCAIRPDFEKGSSPANQLYGSALTSMKRYVYAAILNLHTGGDKE